MIHIRNIMLLALGTLAGVSCNRNMFDEEDYNRLVEIAQPVDDIDGAHTWQLTNNYYISVEPGSALPGATRLLVLSANPATGASATILGDYPLSGSSKEYVAFAAPATLTSFYAALTDGAGNYTLTPFRSTERTIDFAQPVASRVQIDSRLLGRQTFSYCFEDEMPEPGDYDYNDVVLRISQERTGSNQITLDVTLAAVGSLSQVAAAIRLPDYKYEDIESVTTLDNETFDAGYKKSALPFIDGTDLLLRGMDGEAVLNLFEDAHWATGAVAYAKEGYIPRYKFNVSKTTSEDYDMMSPRTISYVITFKNPVLLNYFTLDQLDPFAIIEYNGILMEEHAAYKFRAATVLHEYTQPQSAVILPWALIVPDGAFRYPLDGIHIGYSKEGALFGAYMTGGHAFGQWATNHTQATDWYHYPTGNMVY